jgi:hypothetical protein
VTEYKFKIGQLVYSIPKGRASYGHRNRTRSKRLPARKDGVLDQERRRRSLSGHKRERIAAPRLTSSMPALPTGSVRHFGAFHLVSQPPPGLSHSKPKGLVSVGLRRACHHHTLLDQVFVNCDLHCTIPFVRTSRKYER